VRRRAPTLVGRPGQSARVRSTERFFMRDLYRDKVNQALIEIPRQPNRKNI
jgi:hypothetical protein